MGHIRKLAVDIGARPAGSPGEESAAAYLEEVFTKAGYQTARQEFRRFDGGSSANVIARFAGVDYTQGYLLVGGHFDTTVKGPGANDNASGVGVMLAIATAIKDRRVPVEFAGLAAEEYPPSRAEHHAGSRAYVRALADPAVVRGMVSLDMVGAGPAVLIVRLRGSSDALQTEIGELAHSLGIRHRLKTEGAMSDHEAFAQKGVPAAWLWSGSHPTLHKASDTFEVVQPEAVGRAGTLTLEWIRSRLLP